MSKDGNTKKEFDSVQSIASSHQASGNSKRTLVDKYVAYLKNHRILAVLIVFGLSVIVIAKFTDAMQNLLDFMPSTEEKLPDLMIYKVDLENSKVHIVNRGEIPVSTDELYLAWSEGWYNKPEWNNATIVGEEPYIDGRQIEPGESLPVIISGLNQADEDTEFMIDAGELIEELNESNNCVNVESEIIPCRRSLSSELRDMLLDDESLE